MSIEDVKYLVLHCSGTRCNENYTPEMLQRDHRAMNLRDVGYHFYAAPNASGGWSALYLL